MKKLLLVGVFSIGLSACGRTDTIDTSSSAPVTPAKPLIVARRDTTDAKFLPSKTLAPAKVEALTKDFDTWYRYAYYNVPLSRDFEALDIAGRPSPKKAFLRQLATGKVLALLNGNEHNRPVYQLYAYTGKQRLIRSISQQFAEEELIYIDREGKPLPAFHFTDLQGKTYTPATRGSTIVGTEIPAKSIYNIKYSEGRFGKADGRGLKEPGMRSEKSVRKTLPKTDV